MVNALPEKPTAKVIIDGLFVLCINKQEKYAELGVYELADKHDFSIKITKRIRGKETQVGEVIEIRPEKLGTHMKDISIKVKNRVSDLDIFQAPAIKEEIFLTDPANRKGVNPESPQQHQRDFRWVLDLEGKLFHKRKLSITPGTLERKIRISNGVMSVRNVAPRSIKYAFPEAARLASHTLERSGIYVAYQIAVDLVADSPDNSVIISYNQAMSEKLNKISLAPSEDYYYEIFLNNNCPEPEEEDAVKKYFSDFQHYYNVFSEVLANERYDFGAINTGGGSRSSPCDLILLGQHEEL